jgi:hypothetical protein
LLAQLLPNFFSAQQKNKHATLNSDGQKRKGNELRRLI